MKMLKRLNSLIVNSGGLFNPPYVLVLVLLAVITYNLYNFCTEYFDKDGRFVLAGKLPCANIGSATLMNDGNVFLLTDPSNNPNSQPNYNLACHNIAQIYDTKTNKVKYAGKPFKDDGIVKATLLKNGKVLILSSNPKSSAKLYNSKTGNYSSADKMIFPRNNFSMLVLPDGKVFIAGGYAINNYVKQCEVFDPNTNKFYAAGNVNIEDIESTSILKNGNVLIIGGLDKKIELYNTHSNKSKIIGKLSKPNDAFPLFSSSILLNDGRVLIFNEDYSNNRIVSTMYNPDNNKFTELNLYDKKLKPYAYTALLNDGRILIVGGRHPVFMGYSSISTAEIFDPKTNTFKPIKNQLKIARSGNISVALKNGNILIIAGYGNGYSPIKQTELFIPNKNNR